MQFLGWRIHFLDVDNGGLKICWWSMECVPELDKAELNYRYRQPRLLYWNVGGGRFKDWSASAGAGITEPWVSRGSAVGDLDWEIWIRTDRRKL